MKKEYINKTIDFIKTVDTEIIPIILNNNIKFISNTKLIEVYKDEKESWISILEKPEINYLEYEQINHHVYSRVNELMFAIKLLEDKTINKIEYEIPLIGTNESIDFTVYTNNKIFYVDVKTIQSKNLTKEEENKAWNDYLKMKGKFKGNISLYKDGMGGQFWHDMKSSRSKMRDHILGLEKKEQYIKKSLNTNTIMLFCGNGTDFTLDQLQDFASKYKRKDYSSWDHLEYIEKHFMKTKNIEFKYTVDDIWFLERGFYDIDCKTFWNIIGPK